MKPCLVLSGVLFFLVFACVVRGDQLKRHASDGLESRRIRGTSSSSKPNNPSGTAGTAGTVPEAASLASRDLQTSLTWERLSFDDFEDGWGNFNDGGSDASRVTMNSCTRRSSSCARENTNYLARIRDDSGEESSIASDSLDASAYDFIRVTFFFFAYSMDINANEEKFVLEYSTDGFSWQVLRAWEVGVDFDNDIWYEYTALNEETGGDDIIDVSGMNEIFIRFRCDASGNSDHIYLTDIEVEGAASTTSSTDSPSKKPSVGPSALPSAQHSASPSVEPSLEPSRSISLLPSWEPSFSPSSTLSLAPSSDPSSDPSELPSTLPSLEPSAVKTTLPSSSPSSQPTTQESAHPSSSILPSTPPTPTPPPPPATCGDGSCAKECSGECHLDPNFDASCCHPGNDNGCDPGFIGCADVNPPTPNPLTSTPSGNPSNFPSSSPSTSSPSSKPSSFPSDVPTPEQIDPCEAEGCDSPGPCEVGIGTCDSSTGSAVCTYASPCSGVCIGGDSSYTCECPRDTNPCPGGQACQDGIDQDYQCVFTGLCTNTGALCTVFDDCFSCVGGSNEGDPCTSDGDCSQGTCNPPQQGVECDKIDHCDPNPCHNGGQCTDVGGTYECSCSPGWEGPTCAGPDQDYGYVNDDGTCGMQSTALPNAANTVIQFWAMGDYPYDEEAKTCLSTNGDELSGSVCNYCGTKNGNIDRDYGTCSYRGTDFTCAPRCTFEGREYNCWMNTIAPWMNSAQNSNVACGFFVGDFLKGRGKGNSGRCNPDSFASRKNLFNLTPNFLPVTGDNDWNECNGFSSSDNGNVVKVMWRDHFANINSPFYQFQEDFPQVIAGYGTKPPIKRLENYEEIFFFLQNDVAFFGLNRPASWDNLNDKNIAFVTESLESMHVSGHNVFSTNQDACEAVKSVVVSTHINYSSGVRNAINNYFATCNRIVPILNLKGNGHSFCFQRRSSNEYRLQVGGDNGQSSSIEQSDPHLVSILTDPDDPTTHYFHVERNDGVSNSCNGF